MHLFVYVYVCGHTHAAVCVYVREQLRSRLTLSLYHVVLGINQIIRLMARTLTHWAILSVPRCFFICWSIDLIFIFSSLYFKWFDFSLWSFLYEFSILHFCIHLFLLWISSYNWFLKMLYRHCLWSSHMVDSIFCPVFKYFEQIWIFIYTFFPLEFCNFLQFSV